MNAYDKRVRKLEAEGLTTSDAQGAADAEILKAKRHTPVPWHTGLNPGPMIYGPQGEQVADLTADLLRSADKNKANSIFIIRACNAHDDLLAALAKCVDALLNVPVVGGIYDQQHSDTHMRATLDAHAAIAKATGTV